MNKKLTLEGLRVRSFVTAIKGRDQTVIGGRKELTFDRSLRTLCNIDPCNTHNATEGCATDDDRPPVEASQACRGNGAINAVTADCGMPLT